MKRSCFLLFFPILIACGSGERVSKEVFEEVNQSMQVKKLSDAEIIQSALEWGDSISIEAQKLLISKLQTAITEEGISGAVSYCNVHALALTDSLSEKHGVILRRVSNAYRNPQNKPDEMEGRILETYEYDIENNIEPTPNIQAIENGEVLLYSKAIVIENGLCLNCHGDPGKNISAATQNKIDSLYPNDLAKNYQLGELRGMWSIAIPKKEVVKRM